MDTILVVDDDPVMRVLLERMLKHDGFALLNAEDGVEAQDVVRATSDAIAGILLDWQMPNMNGLEFLKWIKKEPDFEHIPVIMATSMKDPENIRDGIDAGAFYYLTKPIEEKVLRSIVRAAISDLRQKQSLLERIRRSDNPLGQLIEGVFKFRTTDEAEFLAVAIANASPIPDKAMVISEIMINAVEHGNLGIAYEEKTDYINNNTLRQEVERRLALPENAEKFVEMKIKKYANGITVELEDKGAGFDFARYLRMDESRVFDNHGRGIALSGEYLDLNYVGKGNRVVVTIPNA